MRHTWTAIVAAAAALSACGQSTRESAAATGTVSLHNASMGEVTEQVAAANGGGAMLDPGHWEGTVKIVDMAMPNMDRLPPAVREQMKARMSQGNAFSSCVTPEQAADARKTFTEHQRGDCTYDHFTMAAGTISAAMTCKAGSAMQKMTMSGTYSRTAYHLTTQASGSGDGPAGVMSMKMEMDARRTGDCAPGEKANGK